MDRVRQVTAAVGLAALVAAGCAGTRQVTRSVSRAVRSVEEMATPPVPATQFITFWQRRPAPLPDPSKDGALAPGLAGQMFLIGADGSAATVAGDVTVALHDDTPGRPPHTAEVYHFTAEVVRKLATEDERFGKSYALFLPWPADWRDVTAVRVLARYDAPGLPLHAEEVKLVLDLSDGPVWQDQGGQLGVPRPAVGADARTVPDGAKLVRQAQAAAAAGSGPNVRPAGGPVMPSLPPPVLPPTTVGAP